MGAARDLVTEAFRTEEHALEWRAGLAGAAATIGPLALGMATDDPMSGLIAAIGALNGALSMPAAGVRSKLWMGSVSLLSLVAAFALADLVRDHDWAVVLLSSVWTAAWAFTRAAGRAAGILGFANSAALVVLVGVPASPAPFGEQLLWFALGALAGGVSMALARRGAELSEHVARDSLRAVRHAVGADPVLRAHAARVGLAVAASTAFYLAIDLPHGYWVALTTLAILQPGEHATHVRSVQRGAGTLAGAALIVAITLITGEPWVLVAGAMGKAFFLYALDARGYFWLVVLITPTVLFMLSSVDFQGDEIGLERVSDSSLGILVGLAFGEITWRLWPNPGAAAPATS